MIAQFVPNENFKAEDYFNQDMDYAKSIGVKEPLSMPYFKDNGSETAILLIHGFTATPYELIPLREVLEKRGFSIYSPLLSGHGSDIQFMSKTSFELWYESVKNGYLALNSIAKNIIVIGQSLGGCIATLVAANNKVDKLILLAPAFKVRDPLFYLAKFVHFFNFSVHHNIMDEDKPYYHNQYSVKGLYQLYRLQNYIKKNICKLDTNLFILVSRDDSAISSKAVEKFFYFIECKDKELDILDNKKYDIRHVLTKKRHNEILDMILDFILGNRK